MKLLTLKFHTFLGIKGLFFGVRFKSFFLSFTGSETSDLHYLKFSSLNLKCSSVILDNNNFYIFHFFLHH